jgi:hypothetical protein
MGWIWSDAPKQEDAVVSTPPIPNEIPSTPPTAPSRTAITTTIPKPKSKPNLSPDELAEAEFQQFLADLKTESEEPSTPSTPPAIISKLISKGSSTTQHEEPPSTTPLPSATASSISPYNIYPSTLSCRAAFDAAFYCQSLGGQFTNLYRYGNMRDCSQTWKNFWFCMRTNRGYMSEEEREERVKEHYWNKDRKYREGPSSEDVWRLRESPVEGAFEGDWRGVLEEMRRAGREEGVGRE